MKKYKIQKKYSIKNYKTLVKVNCNWCGKETIKAPCIIARGEGKFCSTSCSNKYRWKNINLITTGL